MSSITKAVILLGIVLLTSMPSVAGNCRYDSDRASDGSRCGKRSSESRPGGY